MKKTEKLFFETRMTWKRVLLLAVGTAVLTAVLLILPFTKDTSFENIGVSFESWILFALFVILNCEKPLEAGIKTFVFFLVSQPLIYLLQVPFSSLGWGLFGYYGRWFVWTVLSFPGAMLAWYVKEDRWYSPLILSAATGFLGWECVGFARTAVRSFPRYLLSAVFCAALAVFLILLILKGKKRLAAFALTAAVVLLVLLLPAFGDSGSTRLEYDLPEGNWEITETRGDAIGTYSIAEGTGNVLVAEVNARGIEELLLRGEDGQELTVTVSSDGGFPDITVQGP